MVDFIKPLRVLRGKRFPFKFVYSDSYWMVNLGDHVFPIKKYRLIYESLLSHGAKKENFTPPVPASDEDLLLIHTEKYLNKVKSGKLSHTELATLEIPYSLEGLEFALLSVGGTIQAAELALEDGLSIHLGGGFHHAFPDHGEGFCVFNDVAVAVEKMKRDARIQTAMIVDCDVHQGNGTAAIFAQRDDVFTFSIHQMDLYPAEKPSSSLDIGLWSGDDDEKYLPPLRNNFPSLYEEFQPDLVFFLAGADPFERDQLANLKVTFDGLEERDKIIIENARKLGIPTVIVLAGGYAHDVADTVSVHWHTIKVAQKIQRKYPALMQEASPLKRKRVFSAMTRLKSGFSRGKKKSQSQSIPDNLDNH